MTQVVAYIKYFIIELRKSDALSSAVINDELCLNLVYTLVISLTSLLIS